MRIVVYDIAAEDGGGLFVLKNFYDEVSKFSNKIEWIFIVSLNSLTNKDNVIVLRYKNVKISWLHRLAFEKLELPKVLKKIDPDLIISLQNIPVPNCKYTQFVYLHQSLQFCKKKFSFCKKEERSLAIRQRIICNYLYRKILPSAAHIFVQTNWIKKATEDWINYPSSRITVVPVKAENARKFIVDYTGQNSRTFFYPARAEIYKNHQVIIQATKILISKGYANFNIIFTMSPEENNYSKNIFKTAINLPIKFVGILDYDLMWKYYSNTVLLFSSYLETCGLPLLEAKYAKSRILASDLPFSHEALDSYPNAKFFKYDDPIDLAEKMKEMLDNPTYINISEQSLSLCKSETMGLVERMLEEVL